MRFSKWQDLVAVGVLFAILGAIVSTAAGWLSAIYCFFLSWQTLMTGILAIIAARWTVQEMQRAHDASQAERQREALFRRRHATLKVHETIYPLWREVQEHMDKLEAVTADPIDAIARYNTMAAATSPAGEVITTLLQSPSIALYHDSGIDFSWPVKHATAITTLMKFVAGLGSQEIRISANVVRTEPILTGQDYDAFCQHYRALEYSLKACIWRAMEIADARI